MPVAVYISAHTMQSVHYVYELSSVNTDSTIIPILYCI